MISSLLLTSLLLTSTSPSTLEVEMPPKAGEDYKTAKYRIWLPPLAKTIRAIIVRQHGCGRNGIDMPDDLQWQALATKHSAAILGTHYTTNKDCGEWFEPGRGSERAFLEALAHFAKETKHPELALAPWALWGHSGGSLWGCHMINRHPTRVVALWARSASLTEFKPEALTVPVMFNYGEGEKTGRFEKVHQNSAKAFETYGKQSGLWAIAVDPKSSHDCRNSRDLAILYFDYFLGVRIPKEFKGDGPIAVLKHEPDQSREYQHYVINATFAAKWEEYRKTGSVKDTTPPSSPYPVARKDGDDGVTLTWKAEADLESGVKVFFIQRDGVKIASVGSEKSKGNPNGYFQIWNYGDEPEPRAPEMKFVDKDGKQGSSYTVIQVNHVDLESKPGIVTMK